MRFVAFVASALTLLGGVLAIQSDRDQVVIFSGDTGGYLSPCGCSSPMMGGIRRRATAIRKISKPGRTTILENGGLVDTNTPQDELKAETIAQSMTDLGVSAINVGPSDVQLGRGSLLQLSQLSNRKLLSLSLAQTEEFGLQKMVSSGPFLIGGATEFPETMAASLGALPVKLESAVQALVNSAAASELRPILMLLGGHDAAVRIAREFPQLALIQYSSIGVPSKTLERVGTTGLVTTGEHGKYIAKVNYHDGQFEGYEAIALGPAFGDDPVISRFYAAYLRRVRDAKLLEKTPRRDTAPYAGSWACMTCHQSAAHIWKSSEHRFAFQTLVKQGHDADPDCVSCHVTGLASNQGFRSLAATPQFAGVGCESCHGPALAHAKAPTRAKLPKLTKTMCVGCHNPLNSSNFQFESYWKKIAH